MSDKTETTLLSPERLAGIQSIANRSGALHYTTLADYYREDVPALLADREAFRRQVAAELKELLAIADAVYQYNGDFGPFNIEEAATRLGIDL